jgi:peptidoglycan L-alanyl-D-glutamate endopeptidase CwlK
MAFTLSKASRAKLSGVRAPLCAVVERAIQITPVDFKITEGLRTVTRQKQLFAAGASKTMNSRHLTGHAVDVAALVGGQVRWDWPLYGRIADAFKQAALERDIPIVWGGDWTTLKDGPHFELDRRRYP